jgi:hypothetical protein
VSIDSKSHKAANSTIKYFDEITAGMGFVTCINHSILDNKYRNLSFKGDYNKTNI